MLYAYLWLKAWLSEDEGQDMIEYVIIVALIVIGAIVAIGAAGTQVQAVWNRVASELTTAL